MLKDDYKRSLIVAALRTFTLSLRVAMESEELSIHQQDDLREVLHDAMKLQREIERLDESGTET